MRGGKAGGDLALIIVGDMKWAIMQPLPFYIIVGLVSQTPAPVPYAGAKNLGQEGVRVG